MKVSRIGPGVDGRLETCAKNTGLEALFVQLRNKRGQGGGGKETCSPHFPKLLSSLIAVTHTRSMPVCLLSGICAGKTY